MTRVYGLSIFRANVPQISIDRQWCFVVNCFLQVFIHFKTKIIMYYKNQMFLYILLKSKDIHVLNICNQIKDNGGWATLLAGQRQRHVKFIVN